MWHVSVGVYCLVTALKEKLDIKHPEVEVAILPALLSVT
jgi:hypothetical protein